MRRSVLALVVAAGLAGGLAGVPQRGNAQSAGTPTGTIAYLLGRGEIRLIEPDGSHDRLLFRPPSGTVYRIEDVAWRPDGKQLAFASGHEGLCSAWQDDIYLIDPDGSNLRRLTNGPSCAELAGRPAGNVTVTLANDSSDVSDVFVYVQGATAAQLVTVEPGFSQTVTLTGVADLGDGQPQYVVAINADRRWFDAAVSADVRPDVTSDAGTLHLDAVGIDAWGALSVSWSPDGTRIAYQLGQGGLWQVGVDAPALGIGGTLLDPSVNDSVLGTQPAWSPVNDQILYANITDQPETIDVVPLGASSAGTPLVENANVMGLSWFPDGSGFVASDSTELLDSADLYLYDLTSGQSGQLTTTGGFAVWPSVSPDGGSVAYVYSDVSLDQSTSTQLRIRDLASGSERVLVENGVQPDWR